MNHEKTSDATLLKASDKDAVAFRALYNRYTERIKGYHLRRCRDEQAALDLTAETFAQAWCARRAFRDEASGSAGPWLYGIDELLDELPADQRSALELRVLEDLPYDGVASRLSITPENARMRVHRALGALRRQHSLTTQEKR